MSTDELCMSYMPAIFVRPRQFADERLRQNRPILLLRETSESYFVQTEAIRLLNSTPHLGRRPSCLLTTE
jgi:hypothetical protein